MAKQTFHVTELDPQCHDYLIQVRKSGGRDMAGIFLSGGAPHSAWAFPLTGAVILCASCCCFFQPLASPLHEAMLLTAGLLLGGWFILAGFRITIAYLRGYDLGSFTYADPHQLWVVNHSMVERWPIKTLESVTINGQELALEYPNGVERVTIPFEIGVLEIAAYLDSWVQARGDGELDQQLIDGHAAVARATAYDQAPADQPNFSTDIPTPSKEGSGRRPWDWPILLALVVGSILLFVVVNWVVHEYHDLSVFNHVRGKTPNELRRYLLDPNNKRYREQVTKLLHERYQQKADQLKRQILANKEPGFEESAEAMPKLMMYLADAPASLVTMQVTDRTEPQVYQQNGLPVRREEVQKEIADGLYDAIGQDLIALAPPPEETPAFLEVEYKIEATKIAWTMTLRLGPDAEPIMKATFASQHNGPRHANDIIVSEVQRIKKGLTGVGPPPPVVPQLPLQP